MRIGVGERGGLVTGPLMNNRKICAYVMQLCLACCLINGSALARDSDHSISGILGPGVEAKDICTKFLAAERAANWQECYRLLSTAIRNRYRTVDSITPFITELSVPPDGYAEVPPSTSSYGSGPGTMVVKLSTPVGIGYGSMLFMLRRNSDDGKWGIAFAFPSKLSSLFVKCVFDDTKNAVTTSP